MFKWIVLVSVRLATCVFPMALIGAIAVIATNSNSFAEEKKAKQQKKDPQKDQQTDKQPPQAEAPQLIFSPWTKFCQKGQEANPKQICFIGKEGRVQTGQPVVSAVLIEPEGEPRKVLRITLPLGMSLQQGTRAIVDQGQPMTAPYVICFDNGCMADYEASPALIDTMKKGQGLVIQGINGAGQGISVVLPLSDFAKAYDGPPISQDELNRRNEEDRKKFQQLQQQQQKP
jgi:invasion protein IalB